MSMRNLLAPQVDTLLAPRQSLEVREGHALMDAAPGEAERATGGTLHRRDLAHTSGQDYSAANEGSRAPGRRRATSRRVL